MTYFNFPLGVFENRAALDAAGGGGPPGSTNTWDPANHYSNITLSGSNLTATSGFTGGLEWVFATNSTSSGLKYCEFLLSSVTAPNHYVVGISNSSAPGAYFGIDLNSTAINAGSGGAILNNSSIGTSTTSSMGDTLCMAVDFGHQLIWYRTISGGTPGNWNNNVSGDPTNSSSGGGFSFAGINSGPYFVVADLDSYSGNTTGITANFGATSFLGAMPSGYSTW